MYPRSLQSTPSTASLSNVQPPSSSQGDPVNMYYKNAANQRVRVSGHVKNDGRFHWRDNNGITWSAPTNFLFADKENAMHAAALSIDVIRPESLPEMLSRVYCKLVDTLPPQIIEGAYAGDRFIAQINGVLRSIPQAHVSTSMGDARGLPAYTATPKKTAYSTALQLQHIQNMRQKAQQEFLGTPQGKTLTDADVAASIVSNLESQDVINFFGGVKHPPADMIHMVKAMALGEQQRFFRQSGFFAPLLSKIMTDTHLPPEGRAVYAHSDYCDSGQKQLARNAAWLARRVAPLAVSGTPLGPIVWQGHVSESDATPFVGRVLAILNGRDSLKSNNYQVNAENGTGEGDFRFREGVQTCNVTYKVSPSDGGTPVCRFSVEVDGSKVAEFSMATNCNSVHDFFKGSYVEHALDWLDKAAPDIFSRDQATARDVLEDLSEAFRKDYKHLKQHKDRITKHVKDFMNRNTTLNSAPLLYHLVTNGECNFAVALAKKNKNKTVEVENALAEGYSNVLNNDSSVNDFALEKAMLVQMQDLIGTRRLSQETLGCIADEMCSLFNITGDARNFLLHDRAQLWSLFYGAVDALSHLSARRGLDILEMLDDATDLPNSPDFNEQKRACISRVSRLLSVEMLKVLANSYEDVSGEEVDREQLLTDLQKLVSSNRLDREGLVDVLYELSLLLPEERKAVTQNPNRNQHSRFVDICEEIIRKRIELDPKTRGDLMANFSFAINKNENAPEWFNEWLTFQMKTISAGPMNARAGVALANLAAVLVKGACTESDQQHRIISLMEGLVGQPMLEEDRDEVLDSLRVIKKHAGTLLASPEEFSGRLDAVLDRIGRSGA